MVNRGKGEGGARRRGRDEARGLSNCVARLNTCGSAPATMIHHCPQPRQGDSNSFCRNMGLRFLCLLGDSLLPQGCMGAKVSLYRDSWESSSNMGEGDGMSLRSAFLTKVTWHLCLCTECSTFHPQSICCCLEAFRWASRVQLQHLRVRAVNHHQACYSSRVS